MNWYPWLNKHYQKIIELHHIGQAHHALLIQAIDGMGDDSLVWGISRWLMCQQHEGFKSCGRCHGCQLMLTHNHPDWYRLKADKGKVSLGIDAVRNVIEKFHNFAQQGGAKIVWLPDASQLTEAAANAFLKTLEEPPANCWFFLSSREPSRLMATLRSRCMTWHLCPPDEEYSLQWLQKHCACPQEALCAAIRLSNGAPAAALTLLQPERWQTRQKFCQTLLNALRNDDILQLIMALNSEDVAERLSWMISLLVDVMKVQQGVGHWLSNGDHMDVVKHLLQRLNSSTLDKSVQQWIMCRDRLQHVSALNRELILTDYLLAWGRLLTPS